MPSDRRCTIHGCRRPARIRGLCGLHFERWRYYSPGELHNRVAPPPAPTSGTGANGRGHRRVDATLAEEHRLLRAWVTD